MRLVYLDLQSSRPCLLFCALTTVDMILYVVMLDYTDTNLDITVQCLIRWPSFAEGGSQTCLINENRPPCSRHSSCRTCFDSHRLDNAASYGVNNNQNTYMHYWTETKHAEVHCMTGLTNFPSPAFLHCCKPYISKSAHPAQRAQHAI